MSFISRRRWLTSLAAAQSLLAQKPADDPTANKDWTCPMDPDVHSDKPGLCPRCHMQLVLVIPDRVEYPLELTQSPAVANPGQPITLTLKVIHPDTNKVVRAFTVVHEKLMHLFVVSQNLQFFAHEHPTLQSDGTFQLPLRLPFGGMYRLLADFYPTGSVPQLALNTLFVTGHAPSANLQPALAPCKAANLTASLRCEPEEPPRPSKRA